MPITILVGEVNEKSSAIITLNFTDEDGAPFVPDAVYVALNCATEGTQIRAEQSVPTPAATMNIPITATENSIHDATNAHEIHEVTVRATYDGTSQVTASGKYKVLNLAFLS